ncbi:MAG: tetratricopeptide repeat protein [Candidatus Acidiferrales bacterium]
MNRLAVIALPVALIVASPILSQARQSSSTSSDAAGRVVQTNAPDTAPMTGRQTQEMRADILMARKMYGDAIHVYEALLASTPSDAELLNKIGVAYQQEGNETLAGRYYKRAMKADKTYASAINNYGTVEYEKKHYGRAVRIYREAIALHPTSDLATVYSNLGYAYFGAKQYSRAMDSFDTAIALDPQIFNRHGGYGSTVQQRYTTEPGLFYFLVAKTYARQGDVLRCAHYLRMSRDDGYKDFLLAQTDPEFSKVIKDPRIQEVLVVQPSYAGDTKKPLPPQ